MKLARLIITFREDLIDELRRFYLDCGRTDFLVLACNRESVDISRLKESDNFRLVPYAGPGPKGSISGLQYHVWLEVIKKFPGFGGWVIHDYDLVCKPSDEEIFSKLKSDEYAMIGRTFPVWQKGMKPAAVDTYPFPQGHEYWCAMRGNAGENDGVRRMLLEKFPVYFGGVKTFLGGYGDFLATATGNLLLLDLPEIRAVKRGGVEQIHHSVFAAKGITPVDMRQSYRAKIKLDGRYLSPGALFGDRDFLHPVKFWPGVGRAPTGRDKMRNVLTMAKTAVKRIIGREGWHEW